MKLFNKGQIDVESYIGGKVSASTELILKTNIRNTIIDHELPLNKIIGFKINSAESEASGIITDRDMSIKDSMLEMINNLSKVIFLPTKVGAEYTVPTRINTKESYPEIDGKFKKVYSASSNFTRPGVEIRVVDENLYLYQPLTKCDVSLYVIQRKGKISFMEALDIIESSVGKELSSTFIGVPNLFSLKDYVRILPDMSYRLYNGMTDDILNHLWDTSLGKEWLSNVNV